MKPSDEKKIELVRNSTLLFHYRRALVNENVLIAQPYDIFKSAFTANLRLLAGNELENVSDADKCEMVDSLDRKQHSSFLNNVGEQIYTENWQTIQIYHAFRKAARKNEPAEMPQMQF